MPATYLWQGFRHEWLREVLGFRLPHRISRLHSHVTPEGRFSFAQSTGVDGNYMRPLGLWAKVGAPDIIVAQEDVSLTWRDEVDTSCGVPMARSTRSETLTFSLPPEVADAEVVLRGIRLDTRCCDAHQPDDQPCNSNGFWPTAMAVQLGAVSLREGVATVPLEVTIDRGWTPTRGGVPLIEEKPLNASLDYSLEVGVTLLGGAEGALASTRARSETRGSARRRDANTELKRVPGARAGATVVGITGFGFSFERRWRMKPFDHLGRYLTALDFRVGDVHRDERTGAVHVAHQSGVWIPRTVVGTDVRTHLETAVLQLSHPEATSARGSVEGSLCIHSSDQAPFFSYWRPGDGKRGPVQSADARDVG